MNVYPLLIKKTFLSSLSPFLLCCDTTNTAGGQFFNLLSFSECMCTKGC